LRVDGEWVPTEPFPSLKRFVEHTIELPVARVSCNARSLVDVTDAVKSTLELGKGVLHALDGAGASTVFSTLRSCPQCGRGFPEPDPRLLSFNSSQGWCEQCSGLGVRVEGLDPAQSGDQEPWQAAEAALESAATDTVCERCHGARLNDVALHLRLRERSISQLTAMT